MTTRYDLAELLRDVAQEPTKVSPNEASLASQVDIDKMIRERSARKARKNDEAQ